MFCLRQDKHWNHIIAVIHLTLLALDNNNKIESQEG